MHDWKPLDCSEWCGLTRGLESIPWAHILLLDNLFSPFKIGIFTQWWFVWYSKIYFVFYFGFVFVCARPHTYIDFFFNSNHTILSSFQVFFGTKWYTLVCGHGNWENMKREFDVAYMIPHGCTKRYVMRVWLTKYIYGMDVVPSLFHTNKEGSMIYRREGSVH
jgi:hypothetical protein